MGLSVVVVIIITIIIFLFLQIIRNTVLFMSSYCSKCFTYIDSFKPLNSPIKYILLSPFQI